MSRNSESRGESEVQRGSTLGDLGGGDREDCHPKYQPISLNGRDIPGEKQVWFFLLSPRRDLPVDISWFSANIEN